MREGTLKICLMAALAFGGLGWYEFYQADQLAKAAKTVREVIAPNRRPLRRDESAPAAADPEQAIRSDLPPSLAHQKFGDDSRRQLNHGAW